MIFPPYKYFSCYLTLCKQRTVRTACIRGITRVTYLIYSILYFPFRYSPELIMDRYSREEIVSLRPFIL